MDRVRVILADPDADFAAMLVSLALKEGVYLAWVNDGPKVVDALTSGNLPDVLLLARNLPGHDAFAILKSIRTSKNCEGLASMVLSATPSLEEEIMSFNLGAIDYVQKPINPKAFLARLLARVRHARRLADAHAIPRL